MTAAATRSTFTWATACHGDSADPTPMHTAALREHLALCTRCGARWPAVAVAADAARAFMGSRLVTTAAVCAALLGASWLIWF
jgi:hypothetical protein